MNRNKGVILSFLFLAWAIIFTHSVVPHHHHVEKFRSEKASHSHNHQHHHHHHHHSHSYENDWLDQNVHECGHDCHNHACHFHVDVLAKISIDKVFISNVESSFFSYTPIEKSEKFSYNTEIVFEQLPKTEHLRGPPFIA